MSDMKEKMHTGELYLPGDDEIMKEQTKCLERLYEYNMTRPSEAEKRANLLLSIFADIGSGTGIFTEQLLNCGYKVFTIEPNGDMRKKAEEKLSDNKGFVSVNGSDSDMKISDKSVDFIT